jgi:hypothetical protein
MIFRFRRSLICGKVRKARELEAMPERRADVFSPGERRFEGGSR